MSPLTNLDEDDLAAPVRRPSRAMIAYALGALRHAARRAANVSPGARASELYRETRGIARFVAGGYINEAEVHAEMVAAGMRAGMRRAEASNTVAAALYGKRRAP
jgi:hypothetical protein